tara:strand:- start:2064 stop:3494 length:1431 start_codon:yes stop_codon:yes gene_type:complete
MKIPFICLFISLLISDIQIPIYNIDGTQYISANEYIRITNADSKFYSKKKKLDLSFNQTYDIVFSQNSSFIMIDNKIYHSYLPIVYKNNDFLIPVLPFVNIINGIKQPIVFIDTLGEFLLISGDNFNINNIEVLSKSNGTIIKINTTNQFNSNIISGAITQGGWLNITIPGGIVDSMNIVDSQNITPVQRIRCIQYNESCQISFLIRKDIDEFDISSNQEYININLRINNEENTQKIKKMREKWLLDTIVLDAGHGGRDPGAIGIGGLQEKTVTLDVAKRLGKLLEQNLGVNVVYTREDDNFVELWKRTQIANESNGDLFISIHANANHKHTASGFETYLLRPGKFDDAVEIVQRENEVIKLEDDKNKYEDLSDENFILASMAQNEYIKESEFLASEIQNQLDYVLNIKNRGVKQAGFWVLHKVDMPNVLIELGFLTSKKDIQLLRKARYRQKMAEAIFRSIVTFKEKYEEPVIND